MTIDDGKLTVGSFLSTISLTMTAIVKQLDSKMSRWTPETAKKVEILMAEIIDLADTDVLDVVRSRQVEQEVLGIVNGRNAG